MEWQHTGAVVLLHPVNETVADHYARHGAEPHIGTRAVMLFDYRDAVTASPQNVTGSGSAHSFVPIDRLRPPGYTLTSDVAVGLCRIPQFPRITERGPT